MTLKTLPQQVQQKLIRGILKMLASDKDLGLCGWEMFSFPVFPAWKSRRDPTRGLDSNQDVISALCHFLFCFLPECRCCEGEGNLLFIKCSLQPFTATQSRLLAASLGARRQLGNPPKLTGLVLL